jgi:cation transport regulator ChaB
MESKKKRGAKPKEAGEKKVREQYYPKQKHIDLLGKEVARKIAESSVEQEYQKQIKSK